MVKIASRLHIENMFYTRVDLWSIMDISFQNKNFNKPPREKANIHLQEFLSTFNSNGVSFTIYHTDKWEWTYLLGGKKRLLLRKLPNHFHKVLPEDKVEATKNLWIVSRTISTNVNYCIIRKGKWKSKFNYFVWILCIDTIFEVVDGLWLTDTTYTNEALVELKGKHLKFPGPCFWHFRKTRGSYCRFTGEQVIHKPGQRSPNGFGDIFQGVKKLLYSAHAKGCF